MSIKLNELQTVANPNHPHIRRIRQLRLREERDRTGLFYVEGLRFVYQAIQYQALLKSLVVCRPLLQQPFAQKLVRQQRRLGIPVLEVTPEVMYSLSLLHDPQGIGAVMKQQWEPLAAVQPEHELCWVALPTVRSPGNLGTILRTLDAVGGAGVIFLGNAADPYEPTTVRATMGAMFAQQFVRTSLADFKRWKKRHTCMLVGTSPSAPTDYHTLTYKTPVVLLMGEERKGLPPEFQSLCDIMVRIPMVGQSDSLNLAVATSVMLYEVFNQRRGNVME